MMIARTCDAVSETRATVRRWVRALVRILPAILAITGLAAAQAAAQDAVWPFDIPSQSLPAALDAFAEQAHVQILYKADSVRDLQSAPVSGQFSPAQALHQLLHGTGLSFQSGGPNTITVVPAPETPNDDIAPPAKDYPRTEKPVKVPEILVKDVREREGEASYVAEATSTATKSDIPLIETPQSISVITRSRMVAQEVNSVAEALRYTSGVQAEPFGFEPRFTFLRFRGFDATQNGLFRDGLQLRNPGFAVSYNLEPYGAEEIDVLRGPASFLYGQGSPGGLLNYITKRPTRESLHELQFLAGNFGRHEGRFDFGGKLNDSDVLSFRLTGLFRESGTQLDQVPNDRIYIAPAVTWQAAAQTHITFSAHFQKDQLGSSQALPAEGTLRFNPNGRIPVSRFTGHPDIEKQNRTESSVGYEVRHGLAQGWDVVHKLRYSSTELDGLTTYSNSFGTDKRTVSRFAYGSLGKLNALAIDNQVHGTFSTGPFHHQLLGGLDFQRITVDLRQTFGAATDIDIFNRYDYGAPFALPPVFLNQRVTQLQTGVYLQDQVKLYDHWLLTLGGRHDWASDDTQDRMTGGPSRGQADRKATGRAALTYLFDNGLAPYISYSTFFLPAIGLTPNGQAFKPETGRQYEVGIKYQIPRTRTFFTAALFDLTRENFIQTDPSTFLQVQRGQARSRGLELEGVASFDSGVDIIASFTLLDNEVRETANPLEKGKRLPQTPAQFGSLWVKYTFSDGSLKGFGIGGGARYTGYTYGDEANTFRVPSYVVGDAAIDYTWKHYRFALNLNNIFNQDQFGCFDRSGSFFCTFGERRTVVGSVTYRW